MNNNFRSGNFNLKIDPPPKILCNLYIILKKGYLPVNVLIESTLHYYRHVQKLILIFFSDKIYRFAFNVILTKITL